MKDNLKKNQLVIWMLIVILTMSLIKIFYKPTDVVETKTVPTPTVLPTPTTNLYPLQSKLPYQGKNFVIEKYIEPMVISVKTKRTDKNKIKEEIIQWWEVNNLSVEGIQIDWQE